MMRAWPYLHKTIMPSKPRDVAASRVDIIEPSTKEYTPPALFLESEFEKVTEVFGTDSRAEEYRRVSGFTAMHAPLKRYEFKNALVYPNGFSVKDGSFERSGPLQHKMLLMEKIEHLDQALFCGTPPAIEYFGHWMMESCCTALLQMDEEVLIMPTRADWQHAKTYKEIFGFAPEADGLKHVERLVWYEDFMQGRSHSTRYRELRRRLRNKFPERESRGKRVYLKRGNGGKKRGYKNEPEIIERLVREGFIVVDIEKDSLETMFNATVGAEIVVTVEGSHQSHALLMMQEGGLLLAIQPSDRFISIYRDRTAALNMDFGFVVAQRQPDENTYLVDEGAVMRTLDLYAERQLPRVAGE